LGRLGGLYVAQAFGGRPLIDFDHHITNTRFGTINIIDPNAASVGEMIFDLVQDLGVPVNRDMATCILTAMVTDTLGFRTSSTTPHTLKTAAVLVEAGAPLSEIIQQSFENRPLPVARVWGEVLSTFSVRGSIAWAGVPRRILERYGVKEDEVKGLVNMLRGTEGVLVSALLMEAPDGKIKVEFRSNGKVDVASIATALGGGGHRAAAGCTLAGPLKSAEERVLGEVRRQMSEQHGRHSQPLEATRTDIP
jgi:phosphoesterase RecJ-like protein